MAENNKLNTTHSHYNKTGRPAGQGKNRQWRKEKRNEGKKEII